MSPGRLRQSWCSSRFRDAYNKVVKRWIYSVFRFCLNVPSNMKFPTRHRPFFLTFTAIWIIGMIITVTLVGRTGRIKDDINDITLDQVSLPRHNQLPPPNSFKMLKPMRYCNPPESIVVGQEGNMKGNLSLDLVAILIRHGDRLPLRPIRNQSSLDCGDRSVFLDSTVNNFVTLLQKHAVKQNQQAPHKSIFSNISMFPNIKACHPGHLTWTGVLQHLKLGSSLGKVYNKQWKLLPENFSPDNLKLYSTVMSRTYQSALAFLYGFLPSFDLQNIQIIPSKNLDFCLKGKCTCPHLRIFERILGKKTRRLLNSHPAVLRLLEMVNKVMKPYKNVSDIMSAKPMFDSLMGFVCQGKSFPCIPSTQDCASIDHVRNLISYLEWEGKQIAEDLSFQKSSVLKTYSLLSTMHKHMTDVVESKSSARLLFFSGHDVNLMPVASALGFDDGTIPPYASRIVLELFSSHKTPHVPQDHFIRILYNGKDVTRFTYFCGHRKADNMTKDFQLCSFRNFTSFIKQGIFRLFNSPSYSASCNITKLHPPQRDN